MGQAERTNQSPQRWAEGQAPAFLIMACGPALGLAIRMKGSTGGHQPRGTTAGGLGCRTTRQPPATGATLGWGSGCPGRVASLSSAPFVSEERKSPIKVATDKDRRTQIPLHGIHVSIHPASCPSIQPKINGGGWTHPMAPVLMVTARFVKTVHGAPEPHPSRPCDTKVPRAGAESRGLTLGVL